MNNIETGIGKSSKAFVDHVWPIVSDSLGGGMIMPVEGQHGDMTNQLDMISGIDFWQVMKDNSGIRGIASRVQPTDRAWNTFTIRRHLASGGETEFHKRIKAIFNQEKGLLFPTITVQAYISNGYKPPVLSVGAVRTKDLYLALLLDYEHWQIKQVAGGNKMVIMGWDDLIGKGIGVKIISRGET